MTPVLGLMLGLAVGIDYALFIVNRHRRQLKAGMDVRESIALANGTSGNAVVFAGTPWSSRCWRSTSPASRSWA